jgi:hypothetical protein
LEDIASASKVVSGKKELYDLNLKLNWANSSSIKPWRPYSKKISVLSLKNKILSIFKVIARPLHKIGSSEANGVINLSFGTTMQKL